MVFDLMSVVWNLKDVYFCGVEDKFEFHPAIIYHHTFLRDAI
jgi:hypothetical protein